LLLFGYFWLLCFDDNGEDNWDGSGFQFYKVAEAGNHRAQGGAFVVGDHAPRQRFETINRETFFHGLSLQELK